MDLSYKKRLNELISKDESNYVEWEDISSSFAYIELAKINNEKVIFVYSEDILPTDVEACRELFGRRGVKIGKEYQVSLDRNPSSGVISWKYFRKQILPKYKASYVFTYISEPNLPLVPRGFFKVLKMAGVDLRLDWYGMRKGVIMLSFPHISEIGMEIRDYCRSNPRKIESILEILEDDESRDVMLELLRLVTDNDVYRLKMSSMYDKYWELYEHIPNEVWVNCGAASGDTILKYISQNYEFRRIFAFEGDKKTFDDLRRLIDKLPKKLKSKISLDNKYIGHEGEKDNFDQVFRNEKVTLINMDIEGAEMGVLRGAEKLIERDHPVLAICAYHKAADWYDIPSYISSIWGGIIFTYASTYLRSLLTLMSMYTIVFRRTGCFKPEYMRGIYFTC